MKGLIYDFWMNWCYKVALDLIQSSLHTWWVFLFVTSDFSGTVWVAISFIYYILEGNSKQVG